jgi:phenylalanyl-tRNA synthetase beta chain
MKVSLNWLSDFVEFTEKDSEKIAEAITMGVAEVDEVEVQGGLLNNCCVGKIVAIESHPNADKLKLCNVETDRGEKKVVCGGDNISEGILVAFAHIGARVRWHGEEMMELKKTKIRGEESEGMICASSELGLENLFPSKTEKEIISLPEKFTECVGKGMKESLGLSDTILHIDNHAITHRPDLFSHLGFSRECVALGLAKWKKDMPTFKDLTFPKKSLKHKNIVECKEDIYRYLSCEIEIGDTGETPDWMKKKLEAVGLRSLSLPVDITNYVMMEVGMPLHSFDSDDINGDINIRHAKEGEEIVTLDDERRKLPDGAIVLSDDEGIFDLLGVMGGLRSSTKSSTKNIYLHSVGVNPVSIRKTIIETGHRTDASTIYEKGVPNITVRIGFNRALQLFLDLVPGAKIASGLEAYGDDGKVEPIKVDLEKTSSLLGVEVEPKDAEKILKDLDFSVKKEKGSLISVIPPLHRLGDVKLPVDIAEEIARIMGYMDFDEEMPEANIMPPERKIELISIRRRLKELGFCEVVRFAFLSSELLSKSGMDTSGLEELKNPLGEDLKIMRPSLVPRLLEYAEENMRFVEKTLKTFEVGRVFVGEKEKEAMSLVVASKTRPDLKDEPFLIAKSAISEMLEAINSPYEFKRESNTGVCQHPARCVNIIVNGKIVGSIYEVHPLAAKEFDFAGRVAVATLDMDAVLENILEEKVYKEVSEYPSITYDITVSLSSSVDAETLLNKTRNTHELLQEIYLSDLYQKGEERQLTFRCVYGSFERTLTEEEVRPVHEKIESSLRGA